MKTATFASQTLRSLRSCLAIVLALAGLFASVPSAQAAVNAQETALFNLIKNDGGQNRPSMALDPILCEVARARALDMGRRGYFDHTNPDGFGPNYLVRRAGYQLPANYDQSPAGNNIESASAGRSSAGDTWGSLKGSAGHADHLLAQNSFYRNQTAVGVGYANVPGSPYTHYWVILTAPPSGPKVAFETPANKAVVDSASLTVTGETRGDPDAAKVQVRVENGAGTGDWVDASGTKNWTAAVSGLVPGENTLRARSLKADNSVLDDATRTVRYVVRSPLTVNISGNGTVSGGLAGATMHEVGKTLSITAKPASGHIFAGWTGGFTSASAKLVFAMEEGLVLTANFIPNPFLAGAGKHAAVFTGDGASGLVRVSLTSNGGFTARLKTGGKTLVFKGTFDAAGNATVSRKGTTLTLVYSGGGIAGTVSGPGYSSGIDLDALASASAGSNPNAGKFTMVLPASESAPGVPQGDGVAVVKVAASGVAKIVGTLADGSAFSASSPIGKAGELAVFANGGAVAGTLHFRATASSDIDGTLQWSAGGFTIDLNAVGSRYVAPAAGQRVVAVEAGANNTALELGEGGLSSHVVQPATLAADNSIVLSSPAVDGLKLSVNAATGRFNGAFVHPQTGAVSKIRGAILQKQNAGFGFFTGGGYATFSPAE